MQKDENGGRKTMERVVKEQRATKGQGAERDKEREQSGTKSRRRRGKDQFNWTL
jgi:hypothetical protein